MPYSLHLERKDRKISLSEWRAAVEATDGVRLHNADTHSATNPKTGENITVRAKGGDAEVFFPDSGRWHWVFLWSSSKAVFAARFVPSETSDPAWRAAVALAKRLGATIRGDQGEMYDLKTGRASKR